MSGGRTTRAVAATLAGLSAGWVVFAFLVWLYGEAPRTIGAELFVGTWGVGYGVGQVLYKATTLLLTGVAVEVALRAGLFNIGGEGQLAVGGLAAATVGAHLSAATPSWIAVPIVVSSAAAAGALWATPSALLGARAGGQEVISTLMMNRIADAVVGLGLARGLALAGTVRTPDVVNGARLLPLDRCGLTSLHGSAASLALPFALLLTVLVLAWFERARVGREIVQCALAPRACAAEGIPVASRLALALVLSGAIAGLAAAGPVLGYKGYYESGLAAGAGFGGIAVALLGRGHPLGLMLAALLFGTLEQGGLVINARVPREVMTVFEGVVIVVVALADARVRVALLSSKESS